MYTLLTVAWPSVKGEVERSATHEKELGGTQLLMELGRERLRGQQAVGLVAVPPSRITSHSPGTGAMSGRGHSLSTAPATVTDMSVAARARQADQGARVNE